MLEQALSITTSMSSNQHKFDTLDSVIKIISEQGKIEEALTIANDISDGRRKRRALYAISAGLYKQGNIEKSKGLFKHSRYSRQYSLLY